MNESTGIDGAESKTLENVRFYGSLGREGLTERIRALDDEWDMERFVTVSLSGLGLFGMVMGLFGSRLWRVLSWASFPLLFLHGQDKWKPSDGILKSLGLRSRKEIEAEKYALKALRGDFRQVEPGTGEEGEILARNSNRAMEAVQNA
ncbi:MAG: hypothetical protein JWP91_3279 [Fibrobacteres bacterium]|nr:hypothetical protein [Fibrobacterota bacterium]